MIPYILAAVGGYLIGDSMKERKTFADGGVMSDIAEITVEVEKVIPDKSIDVSVIVSYDDEANSEKKYSFEIMLSEDGYSIYKGKDSEGKTLSKEEIAMFENNEYFNNKIADAIEDYHDDDDDDEDDDDNYAKGGKIKGDSARVVAENKSGVIMEKSKKKYFLKFADGTEGIYEESELEFTKQYALGGVAPKWKDS